MKLYIMKSCSRLEINQANSDKRTKPNYNYNWGFFNSYYESEQIITSSINLWKDWHCIKRIDSINSSMEIEKNYDQDTLKTLFNKY